MDFRLSTAERAFRDEVREWIGEHHPGTAPAGDNAGFAFRIAWQRALHEGRWAGVDWPEEYGGRGATLIESALFNEEVARAKLPQPANVLGLVLGGPTLMIHGTPEQRERYLEPILAADEIWCQGFSEPGAGSDLAALQTKAVKVDGGFRVTGQKVWTSFAHYAKWCMLVARSDPDSQRHKGLTYFLMDMESEGVEVRPLRQITGEAGFNETFIDNVFIPDEQVVGKVGDGWKVALTTLMNERAGLAFGLQVSTKILLDDLTAEADQRGLLENPVVVDALGDLQIRVEGLRLTAYRGLTAQMKYGEPGPEGSLTKLMWSDTNQRVTELAADLLGPDVLDASSPWAWELLRARGNTIEGGTTEIQKNIIAERVLGLPRLR